MRINDEKIELKKKEMDKRWTVKGKKNTGGRKARVMQEEEEEEVKEEEYKKHIKRKD